MLEGLQIRKSFHVKGFHVKGFVGFLKKEEVGFTYLEDVLSCFFAGMTKILCLISLAKLEASYIFHFSPL